jgi:predicted nucleic acid-binding protein
MAEAITEVETWLESPSLTLTGETGLHWMHLKHILTAANVVGGKTHDARIAAICIQHGVGTLFSRDRDFSRFPELHTVNPLTI